MKNKNSIALLKSTITLTIMFILIGTSSNVSAIPTITNTSNEILTVSFSDGYENLPLTYANNGCNVAGQLDYNLVTMNIPENAMFVSVKSKISYGIDPSKSYFIMGRDKNKHEKIGMPWSIVDAETYQTLTNEEKYAYHS